MPHSAAWDRCGGHVGGLVTFMTQAVHYPDARSQRRELFFRVATPGSAMLLAVLRGLAMKPADVGGIKIFLGRLGGWGIRAGVGRETFVDGTLRKWDSFD